MTNIKFSDPSAGIFSLRSRMNTTSMLTKKMWNNPSTFSRDHALHFSLKTFVCRFLLPLFLATSLLTGEGVWATPVQLQFRGAIEAELQVDYDTTELQFLHTFVEAEVGKKYGPGKPASTGGLHLLVAAGDSGQKTVFKTTPQTFSSGTTPPQLRRTLKDQLQSDSSGRHLVEQIEQYYAGGAHQREPRPPAVGIVPGLALPPARTVGKSKDTGRTLFQLPMEVRLLAENVPPPDKSRGRGTASASTPTDSWGPEGPPVYTDEVIKWMRANGSALPPPTESYLAMVDQQRDDIPMGMSPSEYERRRQRRRREENSSQDDIMGSTEGAQVAGAEGGSRQQTGSGSTGVHRRGRP
ncbi:unnamed protein product [Amoebophrya sp. A120]|nr:unnamed protein product [Amoebophrya sp. A120]|eukprot:GSA120T00009993001.1